MDYYRLIDIYEKEDFKYLLLTFFMGCLSIFPVLGLNEFVFSHIEWAPTGAFPHDNIFYLLMNGIWGEAAKLIPFLVMLKYFRKQISEPIDFIAYICTSALGFAAVENFLTFQQIGPEVIHSRGLVVTLCHMFNSALIGYGFVLYYFRSKKPKKQTIFLYFFLGSLSHSMVDNWLLNENYYYVVARFALSIYFTLLLSVFATILNNSLNNSKFFTYKKVINAYKVTNRLFGYYVIIFLSEFFLLFFRGNIGIAIEKLMIYTSFTITVVVITCVRLGRFKLIKGRWEDLRIKFPAQRVYYDGFSTKNKGSHIVIDGDPYNEAKISAFYNEYFHLRPLTFRNTYFGRTCLAYVEEKVFLKYDKSYFVTRVFEDGKDSPSELYLLRPKDYGRKYTAKKDLIVAVLSLKDVDDYKNPTRIPQDFKFCEWGIMKVLPEKASRRQEIE